MEKAWKITWQGNDNKNPMQRRQDNGGRPNQLLQYNHKPGEIPAYSQCNREMMMDEMKDWLKSTNISPASIVSF